MSNSTRAGRLAGKIALITGGAGTIGTVISRRYLEEGATVILTGRNLQKLEALRAALAEEAGSSRVFAVQMDGSVMAQVREGIAAVVRRHGRIDILVNNAGTAGAQTRLADLAAFVPAPGGETLAQSIGNVLGITWNLIRAAAPHMPPGGSVINISTIFSRADYYGRVPYVVPKAALNALSQAAARELGAHGIRVNLIYPGPIASDRIDNVFRRMDELKSQPTGSTAATFLGTMRLARPDAEGTPTKRYPVPQDVAAAAVFLGSDEAAALSGESLEVTHGMALPAESRTTFTARPGLRAVDGTGRVVLISAGDQVEDVLALTGALRSCGADVVIGLRSREAVARFETILEESRRFAGASYTPPLVLHLDPLETATVDTALQVIAESSGGPHSAVILPARGEPLATSVVGAEDHAVEAFLGAELTGTVTLASRLADHWQRVAVAAGAPLYSPRVIFFSNGDDRAGNVLAEVTRAAVEQLTRLWRHEAQIDASRANGVAPGRHLPAVWANQVVRYVNAEEDGLDFACAATARLLLSDRQVEELCLYLPREIAATTGARVMLAARDRRKLEEFRASIVAELEEVGYNEAASRVQITAECDVAREGDMVALVERTMALFGRVDYLLNNAGISGQEEMVLDMPVDGWRHTLNANLISNYSLIRKLAPQMKSQGCGYILNVSSYFGGEKYAAIAYPNRADYAVSKAGQRALAEAMARFLGPEVQINALSPGPVEGERLKGTGERPGLFMRRARLILENKRLNELYGALVQAHRETGRPVDAFLPYLAGNSVADLAAGDAPEPLRRLAATIAKERDGGASSAEFLYNQSIAAKLTGRLRTGRYIVEGAAVTLAPGEAPPEPFFDRTQIEREARKVRDGVMSTLYLQRMPTEYDVAIATVYYLADRAVSGETFHPSGGLRQERTPVGGELFGKPSAERLAGLSGATAFLIGEYLEEHLELLARAYLEGHGAARVVLLTETSAGEARLVARLRDHAEAGRLHTIVAGNDLEGALDRAVATYGSPGPLVCTPFRALPSNPLVGRNDSDWATVLDEQGFAELCEQQLTHHFRVARKASLMDGVAVALVTPETTAASPTEQFALANFVKTTMHAFTATVGTESERTVHRILVNQVDLTRQARAEEPRSDTERRQELERFVDAVLLTTAPLGDDEDSRYAGRIYRGRAITV